MASWKQGFDSQSQAQIKNQSHSRKVCESMAQQEQNVVLGKMPAADI
jgi:hypothetical protein